MSRALAAGCDTAEQCWGTDLLREGAKAGWRPETQAFWGRDCTFCLLHICPSAQLKGCQDHSALHPIAAAGEPELWLWPGLSSTCGTTDGRRILGTPHRLPFPHLLAFLLSITPINITSLYQESFQTGSLRVAWKLFAAATDSCCREGSTPALFAGLPPRNLLEQPRSLPWHVPGAGGSRDEPGAALTHARDERARKGSRAARLGLGLGDPTAKASKCSWPEGKGEFPEQHSWKNALSLTRFIWPNLDIEFNHKGVRERILLYGQSIGVGLMVKSLRPP